MPKTTSFNKQYGYIRHPEDIDNTCFWCGGSCSNTWDYTPPRIVAKEPSIVAKMTDPLYAVSACKLCINKITYRKLLLNTMEKKALYFKIDNGKKKAASQQIKDVANPEWQPWQCKLENGSFADIPDYMLDEFQRAAKNAYFSSKSGPDQEDPSDSGAENQATGDENRTSEPESPSGNTIYSFE